jgi:uncharacterized membrane protein (DUF485 family)
MNQMSSNITIQCSLHGDLFSVHGKREMHAREFVILDVGNVTCQNMSCWYQKVPCPMITAFNNCVLECQMVTDFNIGMVFTFIVIMVAIIIYMVFMMFRYPKYRVQHAFNINEAEAANA